MGASASRNAYLASVARKGETDSAAAPASAVFARQHSVGSDLVRVTVQGHAPAPSGSRDRLEWTFSVDLVRRTAVARSALLDAMLGADDDSSLVPIQIPGSLARESAALALRLVFGSEDEPIGDALLANEHAVDAAAEDVLEVVRFLASTHVRVIEDFLVLRRLLADPPQPIPSSWRVRTSAVDALRAQVGACRVALSSRSLPATPLPSAGAWLALARKRLAWSKAVLPPTPHTPTDVRREVPFVVLECIRNAGGFVHPSSPLLDASFDRQDPALVLAGLAGAAAVGDLEALTAWWEVMEASQGNVLYATGDQSLASVFLAAAGAAGSHSLASVFLAAAGGGHVAAFEWLWTRAGVQRQWTRPCEWDQAAFTQAATHGHLPLVQWLWAQADAATWIIDPSANNSACLVGAMQNNHLAVVRWLLDLLPRWLEANDAYFRGPRGAAGGPGAGTGAGASGGGGGGASAGSVGASSSSSDAGTASSTSPLWRPPRPPAWSPPNPFVPLLFPIRMAARAGHVEVLREVWSRRALWTTTTGFEWDLTVLNGILMRDAFAENREDVLALLYEFAATTPLGSEASLYIFEREGEAIARAFGNGHVAAVHRLFQEPSRRSRVMDALDTHKMQWMNRLCRRGDLVALRWFADVVVGGTGESAFVPIEGDDAGKPARRDDEAEGGGGGGAAGSGSVSTGWSSAATADRPRRLRPAASLRRWTAEEMAQANHRWFVYERSEMIVNAARAGRVAFAREVAALSADVVEHARSYLSSPLDVENWDLELLDEDLHDPVYPGGLLRENDARDALLHAAVRHDDVRALEWLLQMQSHPDIPCAFSADSGEEEWRLPGRAHNVLELAAQCGATQTMHWVWDRRFALLAGAASRTAAPAVPSSTSTGLTADAGAPTTLAGVEGVAASAATASASSAAGPMIATSTASDTTTTSRVEPRGSIPSHPSVLLPRSQRTDLGVFADLRLRFAVFDALCCGQNVPLCEWFWTTVGIPAQFDKDAMQLYTYNLTDTDAMARVFVPLVEYGELRPPRGLLTTLTQSLGHDELSRPFFHLWNLYSAGILSLGLETFLHDSSGESMEACDVPAFVAPTERCAVDDDGVGRSEGEGGGERGGEGGEGTSAAAAGGAGEGGGGGGAAAVTSFRWVVPSRRTRAQILDEFAHRTMQSGANTTPSGSLDPFLRCALRRRRALVDPRDPEALAYPWDDNNLPLFAMKAIVDEWDVYPIPENLAQSIKISISWTPIPLLDWAFTVLKGVLVHVAAEAVSPAALHSASASDPASDPADAATAAAVSSVGTPESSLLAADTKRAIAELVGGLSLSDGERDVLFGTSLQPAIERVVARLDETERNHYHRCRTVSRALEGILSDTLSVVRGAFPARDVAGFRWFGERAIECQGLPSASRDANQFLPLVNVMGSHLRLQALWHAAGDGDTTFFAVPLDLGSARNQAKLDSFVQHMDGGPLLHWLLWLRHRVGGRTFTREELGRGGMRDPFRYYPIHHEWEDGYFRVAE